METTILVPSNLTFSAFFMMFKFYDFAGCGISKEIASKEHPWAGEDLSLKIDEHDQTICNCILES